MIATGNPDPSPPEEHPPAVVRALHRGLELVADLNQKMQTLDRLMLTGRPSEIAEAAAVVEASLKDASPAFMDIAAGIETLGATNLKTVAEHLRGSEQQDAAALAEELRLALKRFAKRSVDSNRRAQHLNRGLNMALRSLQALGVQESGRLIAEA
jgi:hypothetical protein